MSPEELHMQCVFDAVARHITASELYMFRLAYRRMMRCMGWTSAKAFLWLETKNPMLGGVAPVYMIVVGRVMKLIAFINTQLDEGPDV